MKLEEEFKEHFYHLDLDLRTPSNGRWSSKGRWYDQKNVPDVLSFICECIIKYVETTKEPFTRKDLEKSEFFNTQLELIFGKPPAEETPNEVDKFIGQNLKLLSSAKILKEHRNGRVYSYEVIELDLLTLISQHERNAHLFLSIYIEKVLTDSGFIENINNFFNEQKKGNFNNQIYETLKNEFIQFTFLNTEISKPLEPRRILPKIVNVLAIKNNLNGTKKGRLSEYRISYQDLIYRQANPQDSKKPKGVPRNIYRENVPVTSDYKMQKAKEDVKKYHDFTTEVYETDEINIYASQAHHILPKASYPEYRHERENLIVLTPNQHFIKAHPDNKTQLISKSYQKICLLSKLNSIEKSIEQSDNFYNLNMFIRILNVAYGEIFDFDDTVEYLREKVSSIKINKD